MNNKSNNNIKIKSSGVQHKKRDSSIELLRIIAMFLIVSFHYYWHGGFDFSNENLTFNRFWVPIFGFGGKLGVNIFVIISGYFLINQKIRIKRIVKLFLQILFYSICSLLFFYFTGLMSFGSKEFVKECINAVLPISKSLYWFPTVYFVIYILSPWINNFLKSISTKKYIELISLLVVLWSLFPSFELGNFGRGNLEWFIILYSIGAFIKLHLDDILYKLKKISIIVSIGCYIITVILICVIIIMGTKIPSIADHPLHFTAMDNIIMLFFSISLFVFFKNISFYNKYINILAKASFGVYLIHDNPLIV